MNKQEHNDNNKQSEAVVTVVISEDEDDAVAVAQAVTLETLASDVVSIVRAFIEVLRLEFKQHQNQIHQQIPTIIIPLYTRMKERGLLERVRSILRREEKEMAGGAGPEEKHKDDEQKIEDEDNEMNNNDTAENDIFELQRQKIMLDIALPLAEILARCYEMLDALPPDATTTTTTEKNETNNRRSRQNRPTPTPTPPRGMLSIQDYTDVACLLEFIVCTGILPSYHLSLQLLEESKCSKLSSNSTKKPTTNITNTTKTTSTSTSTPTTSSIVEDRIRTKLPKSLAGRIPKNALRWGTSSSSSSSIIISSGDEKSSSSATAAATTTSAALSLLVRTTEAVTKLVLLDRFRPMLLPRHLVDIYGACFRAEYLAIAMPAAMMSTALDTNDSSSSSSRRRRIGTEYYRALGLSSLSSSSPSSPTMDRCGKVVVVDPTLQAMAYQTLLSSQGGAGATNPQAQQWLRRRVSTLLTRLATENARGLAAIVTVFVPVSSSSLSDASLMSGAAQRLGRTLVAMTMTPSTTTPSTTMQQQKQQTTALQGMLCNQLLNLLVIAFPTAVPPATGNKNNADITNIIGIPPRSMAVIQTAWAVFEHLSSNMIDNYVTRLWTKRLLTAMTTKTATKDTRIHETIRQLGALYAFVPPHSGSAVRFLQRASLSTTTTPNKDGNSDDGNSSILGQILRVATISTPIIGEGRNEIPSKDAERALLWLTQAIYAGSGVSVTANDDDEAKDRVVAAWVSALGPSGWDSEGYYYYKNTRMKSNSGMDVLEVQRRQHLQQHTIMEQFAEMVQSTTERAEFFVDNILLVLAPPTSTYTSGDANASSDDENNSPSSPLQGFPSRIFRFLLRHYLSSEDNNSHDTPAAFSPSPLRLVATVLLPILCEKCSQEQLLFGDNRENAAGLLLLIHEVLSELASSRMSSSRRRTPSKVDGGGEDDDEEDDHPQEFLKSIASILLSMLIAVMELGSKLRSSEEEELLQSFLPTLKSLSISSPDGNQRGQDDLSTIQDGAAMADMAAYAMALIASRKPVASNEHTKMANTAVLVVLSTEDRLRQILTEAETDLGSTQPPIRARGMVSLGRLARGFTGTLSKEQKAPSFIQELDDSGNVVGGDDITFLIGEVLRLSMVALGDTESYVYLAAIQTIVAVGDLHPQQVLPLVASAIVRGELSPTNTSGSSVIELSQEQVIKIAEALMFIIRRRAVTDEYVPMIVNLMLRGTTKKKTTISGKEKGLQDDDASASVVPHNKHLLIQQETEKYFAARPRRLQEEEEENDDDDNDDDDQQEEKEETLRKQEDVWEEQDIRLKTGGPIFDVEEADVVRSLRISVLSELVISASPSSITPYCKVFVRLIVDAMHLEGGAATNCSNSKSKSNSRAVTRSAALLARELYGRLLREARDLTTAIGINGNGIADRSSTAPIPFAVALVASDEELLLATLKKSNSNINSSNISSDSTTIARCQEAVALREEADQEGIFLAARLVIEERKKLEELPDLFRNMISSSFSGDDDCNNNKSSSSSSTSTRGGGGGGATETTTNIFQLNPIEILE